MGVGQAIGACLTEEGLAEQGHSLVGQVSDFYLSEPAVWRLVVHPHLSVIPVNAPETRGSDGRKQVRTPFTMHPRLATNEQLQ